MTSRYDIWRTAYPAEWDNECCDECEAEDGCNHEDCFCHSTDDGDARYDAMKDDQLTGD